MKWPNPEIEFCRVRKGYFASTGLDGPNGAFQFKCGNSRLWVIASNGMNWEHVSVSVVEEKRDPTWREMCWIKARFWGDNECVIQYHPPASKYVNNHPHCLHLWKPLDCDVPMPPEICVGIKEVGVIKTREQAEQLERRLNETMTG